MDLINCNNLSKFYDNKQVLKNIQLNITKGKIIGLLGANGSGKSTLIKIINGLTMPSSGDILVKGKKTGIESKKTISYLPERTYLDPNMNVKEIITYFNDFYTDFNIDKVHLMLKSMDIDVNDKLKTMSKGTKEKVQLALVMSRDADIYILDEPIGGVDPASRDFILKTILTNFNDESTLLISTHLIADIENILDEVIFISKGEIILHQDTDSMREERQGSIDQIFREEFKC